MDEIRNQKKKNKIVDMIIIVGTLISILSGVYIGGWLLFFKPIIDCLIALKFNVFAWEMIIYAIVGIVLSIPTSVIIAGCGLLITTSIAVFIDDAS